MIEPRRSGRQRKSNPKYAHDPLEDLDELGESANAQENSDASSFGQPAADEEEESDDNIDSDASADAEAQIPEDNDNDEDIEIGPPVVVDGQTFSKMDLDELLVGDDLLIDDDEQASRPSLAQRTSGKRVNVTKYAKYREAGSRCRGILLHTSVMSKEITLGEIAGLDTYLTGKLRAERHKWSGTITLPHRKDQGGGRSAPEYPELQDEEVRMNENRTFAKWYVADEGSAFMKRVQATSHVAEADRNKYMVASRPAQTVLLGPFNQQKEFIMGYLKSLSLSEAWNLPPEDPNSSRRNAASRPGWLMNLGSRIITMAWAPSQNGDYQYLAISVESELPDHITRVTAMEPSQPYEASLQIWAFATKRENDIIYLETETKPKLIHVICAKWGSFRRLAWCPAGGAAEEVNEKSIGQLAMITHDGHVRILDVNIDMGSDNPYVKYENVAFASRPPDTNCTCLVWLSANQLAAGCGNGYVAIWNVEQCLAQAKIDFELTGEPPSNAIPYWYHPLHTSHVISIIAQQPYPCQYISTNGVDGQIRLTSIRNPVIDKVLGNRERHIMAPLAYSPHILGHYEIDELDGIRARPMRHFPVSRTIGRAPAQVICLEAGGAHPILLFGCANGSAVVTNPLRRLFIRRITDIRIEAWHQTWFRHEFVPSTRSPPVNSNDTNENPTHRENYIFPRPGVSRFLESHKLEIVSLQRHVQKIIDRKSEFGEQDSDDDSDSRPVKKKKETQNQKSAKKVIIKQVEPKEEDEEIHISIYEEESAVTCVCWNPNINTGGWAAAGMANGLLRVEDLAL